MPTAYSAVVMPRSSRSARGRVRCRAVSSGPLGRGPPVRAVVRRLCARHRPTPRGAAAADAVESPLAGRAPVDGCVATVRSQPQRAPAGRPPSGTIPSSRKAGSRHRPERHRGPDADRPGPVLDRRRGPAVASSSASRSTAAATGRRCASARARARPSGAEHGVGGQRRPDLRGVDTERAAGPATARAGRRPHRGSAAHTGRSAAAGAAPERSVAREQVDERAAGRGARTLALAPHGRGGSDAVERDPGGDGRQPARDQTHRARRGPGSRSPRAPARRHASRTDRGRPAAGRVAAGRVGDGAQPRAGRGSDEQRRRRPARAATATTRSPRGPPRRRSPRSTTARRGRTPSPAARQRQPDRGAEQEAPTGRRRRPSPSQREHRQGGHQPGGGPGRGQLGVDHPPGLALGARIRDGDPVERRRPDRAPVRWATCQAAATSRRSPAPGAAASSPQRAGHVGAQRAGLGHGRRGRPAAGGPVERVPGRPARRPARRPAPRRPRAPASRRRRPRATVAGGAARQPRRRQRRARRQQPATPTAARQPAVTERHRPTEHRRPRPRSGGAGVRPRPARREPDGDRAASRGRRASDGSDHRVSRSRRAARPAASAPGPPRRRPVGVERRPRRTHRDQPVGAALGHRDLAQHAGVPSAPAAEVDARRRAAEASWLCAASRPSPAASASASTRAGHVGGGVGVEGAAAALVAGVERGQQVDHLGAAHLADDQPVGPHPQRLPHQVRSVISPAPSMLAGRASSADHVRMVGPQLAGVLDQHQPLGRVDQAEQRGEQGGLARAGAAADQERQPALRRSARSSRGALGASRARGSTRSSRVNARAPRHPQRDQPCPGRATGASTAWKRVPSAQPDVDVRRGVVEPAAAGRASRWASRRTASSSGKRTPVALEPGAAVDADLRRRR